MVPGHRQKQLTQTLIVRLLKTHPSLNVKSQENRIELVTRPGGISCSVSQYATLCVGAIMVLMTFITIPLMEKVGRRVLHLAGLTGIILCSVMITIAGSEQEAARQKVIWSRSH